MSTSGSSKVTVQSDSTNVSTPVSSTVPGTTYPSSIFSTPGSPMPSVRISDSTVRIIDSSQSSSAALAGIIIGVAVVTVTLTIIVVSAVAWRRHQRAHDRERNTSDDEDSGSTDQTAEEDSSSLSPSRPSTRETTVEDIDEPQSVDVWRRHQQTHDRERTTSDDEENGSTDQTAEQDSSSLSPSQLSTVSTRETTVEGIDEPQLRIEVEEINEPQRIANTFIRRATSIRGLEFPRSHFTMTQIVGEDLEQSDSQKDRQRQTSVLVFPSRKRHVCMHVV